MTELEEYLPFFSKLSEEDRREIRRTTRKIGFRTGDVVHTVNECSGLIVVLSGQLKASAINEDSREITLFRLFERDVCLFSASCVMRNIEFDVEVKAAEDSICMVVPSDVFNSIKERNISVMKFMNDIITSRMSDVMWLMDQVMNKKLDGRLAAFLIEEADLRGTDTLTLTHDEIARHLGSAREVISRTLGYIQREGEVKLGRGYVEIADRDALEKRAELSLR